MGLRVKILYFKARQLLYSYEYLKRIKQSTVGLTQSHLLKSIQADPVAVDFLIDVSKKSGYLLYPVDNHSIYADLIDNQIFCSDVLAPDIDWTCRLKLDDADPIRRLLRHVHALQVDSWFLCGDHHIANTARNNSIAEIRKAVINTLP
jgi:hypothetical protein